MIKPVAFNTPVVRSQVRFGQENTSKKPEPPKAPERLSNRMKVRTGIALGLLSTGLFVAGYRYLNPPPKVDPVVTQPDSPMMATVQGTLHRVQGEQPDAPSHYAIQDKVTGKYYTLVKETPEETQKLYQQLNSWMLQLTPNGKPRVYTVKGMVKTPDTGLATPQILVQSVEPQIYIPHEITSVAGTLAQAPGPIKKWAVVDGASGETYVLFPGLAAPWTREQEEKYQALEPWLVPGAPVKVTGRVYDEPDFLTEGKAFSLDEIDIQWQEVRGAISKTVEGDLFALNDHQTGKGYVLDFSHLPEEQQKNLAANLQPGNFVILNGFALKDRVDFVMQGDPFVVKDIDIMEGLIPIPKPQ